MKLGSKFKTFSILFLFFIFSTTSFSEQKITTVPLINLDKIKPSFEDTEEKTENLSKTNINNLKNKNSLDKPAKFPHATFIGLDKITAKSKKIVVNIDEPKKFGPLEIKVLKCGKVKVNNKFDDVAYMQVKDLTKNEDEKVFIFNGWTFSSDPNLTPFDHAIYDLQLVSCFNV